MTVSKYIQHKKHQSRAILAGTLAQVACVALILAAVFGLGYNFGHNRGRFQAGQDIITCVESGASGWEIGARGVWCLYE